MKSFLKKITKHTLKVHFTLKKNRVTCYRTCFLFFKTLFNFLVMPLGYMDGTVAMQDLEGVHLV